MTETPQNPEPESTPLPDTDIGESRQSIPGVGPTAAGDQPPEPDAHEDTGGPDTQLSPDKD